MTIQTLYLATLGFSRKNIAQLTTLLAEPVGQLDQQSVVVQSVGVLIGSPMLIAGKLP